MSISRRIYDLSKVVSVHEFTGNGSSGVPGDFRFFGKTRAGNGKSHIENLAPFWPKMAIIKPN